MLKFGYVTQATHTYGVVLWSLRSAAASSISVPNLKRIAQFFTKLYFPRF